MLRKLAEPTYSCQGTSKYSFEKSTNIFFVQESVGLTSQGSISALPPSAAVACVLHAPASRLRSLPPGPPLLRCLPMRVRTCLRLPVADRCNAQVQIGEQNQAKTLEVF